MRILVGGLAFVPWAVAWAIAALDPELAQSPWPIAAAAVVPALVVLAWQRRHVVLFTVAFVLAGAAGYAGGRARTLLTVSGSEHWPSYDLAQGPLPAQLPAYLQVTGFYRDQLKLREYATEEGELPNQAEQADAVLIPFVGSREDVLPLDGWIVVARVPADTLVQAASPQTIRGKVEPLDPELLHTLVQLSADASDAKGIMLDTLQVPERREVWTNLAIAAVAALIALACLWHAMATPQQTDRASP